VSQLTDSVTPPWHALAAEEVTSRLEVDPRVGLSSAEAVRRLERDGPNQLAEAPREPRWRAFLRQFQSPMILILMGAAVVSAVVAREPQTPVAILVVVLLNAIIGFVQESKAESALEALRRMSTTTTTVRRDGRIVRLDADELGRVQDAGGRYRPGGGGSASEDRVHARAGDGERGAGRGAG
jgi:Ca2+-transporting ATPase